MNTETGSKWEASFAKATVFHEKHSFQDICNDGEKGRDQDKSVKEDFEPDYEHSNLMQLINVKIQLF